MKDPRTIPKIIQIRTTWGPEITERSGILVLAYEEATDSFEAAEVAYPDEDTELTSGGLAGGMGSSEGIIMATYGEHFLKIEGSEVMDGTDAGTELLMVEAGSEERQANWCQCSR